MMKVLVETSARHVHLSAEHLAALFGEGYALTKKKDLSQLGEFASNERVTVVGPKGTLEGVSILGPTRPASQVELSQTDARKVGIGAPVRASGDTAGSPGCKLIGPAGEIDLAEGVIVAKRHVHLSDLEAAEAGLADKQVVEVRIESPDRTLTFGDVIIRVSPKFAAAMHIDTDESNAAGCVGEVYGIIEN